MSRPCPACPNTLSPLAKVCPRCGHPDPFGIVDAEKRARWRNKVLFNATIVIVMLATVVFLLIPLVRQAHDQLGHP